MNVLVINCGSSSLKYQLINAGTEEVLAKGLVERIGIDADMPDHSTAVKVVLDKLGSMKIDAVGHRVVHGGERFSEATVIDDEVIAAIAECNDLAPLHNPANLIGIKACQELMPGVPMVAVFDTAFHQTMPAKAYTYGIPYEYYEQYKVRRYGFHGTSHAYVSKRAAQFLNRPYESLRTIVCHLGNGASVSAVRYGRCVDTSMGLTPLEGLIMGTRSGDIDPAIVEYLSHKLGKSLEEVLTILNKQSGVQGISGVSSDFRDLDRAAAEGNERAKLAREAFCYRVAKYIGSYVAAMNGVDVICFTAGVGENDTSVRSTIVSEYLGYLGVTLDETANGKRGEEVVISNPGPVTVCVIPTNEELAIAQETVRLVGRG